MTIEELGKKLRMAFYHASDGPRIVLFGPLDADFGSLLTVFRDLSRTHGMTCELHRQPFVAPFGGTCLTLVSSESMLAQKGGAPQGVRRVAGSTSPAFEWHRTLEGWDYLAELIAPFVESPQPGHQYLSRFPGEDAIVVLSQGEYTDDVLTQG
jgi:hypothetical protein